jgi:hypothetical protein
MEGSNNNVFLNYSRVNEIYPNRFNFGPRKLIHAAKFVEETESGLYDKNDASSRKAWLKTFDPKTQLPFAASIDRVKFTEETIKISALDTLIERDIQLGREYVYPPLEIG